MYKVGRLTATCLLIITGGLLLYDRLADSDYLEYVITYWPVFLILLGAEYLLTGVASKHKGKKIKLATGTLVGSTIVAVVVLLFSQSGDIRVNGMSIDIGPFFNSGESGYKYEKPIVTIPLLSEDEAIDLENVNGSVVVQPGDTESIQVSQTMWVSKVNKDKADKIAAESKLKFKRDGRSVQIVSKGKQYRFFGINTRPRINLVVTVPRSKEMNIALKLTNGRIEADGLAIADRLTLRTTNGRINVSGIDGIVTAHTTNGSITAENITGRTELVTTNGSVHSNQVHGDVSMDSTNGSIMASDIDGAVKGDTTNGRIEFQNITGKVRADTTNGGITVASGSVGGDWKLDTTNGRIEITVPRTGDFKISGSAGHSSIHTDLPLKIQDHHLSGSVGTGKYKIDLDTNSGISVNSAD